MAHISSPWKTRVISLGDTSSAVVSRRILPAAQVNTLWEIWSVRATMEQGGTGSLASMGIADGPSDPANFSNSDQFIIQSTDELGAFENHNLIWHWGRSNQKGTAGMETQYLPPEFWWEGEMWAWLQNGAGASVHALYTVVCRMVRFSDLEYRDLQGKVMPLVGWKERTLVT